MSGKEAAGKNPFLNKLPRDSRMESGRRSALAAARSFFREVVLLSVQSEIRAGLRSGRGIRAMAAEITSKKAPRRSLAELVSAVCPGLAVPNEVLFMRVLGCDTIEELYRECLGEPLDEAFKRCYKEQLDLRFKKTWYDYVAIALIMLVVLCLSPLICLYCFVRSAVERVAGQPDNTIDEAQQDAVAAEAPEIAV
jgi:hypothetical protein